MRFFSLAVLMAATAGAQRPSDTPICDYYTKALLKENTAENQATLLTLLVNTVVIGNYTMPNVGVKVPGILAEGQINGKNVNLLPYFSGELASTNTGGKTGVSANFLDGGGAAPLMKNMPADDKSSRQYFLLTHLYQFFGSLLGCTMQGSSAFPSYQGESSMYQVHKFMGLGEAELTYFITQVGLAAASFGVAEADIKIVAGALTSLFGMRCSPPTTVIKSQGAQLQAICIASDCPEVQANATCAAYEAVVQPTKANGTTTATNTMMPTGTQTSKPTSVPSSGATIIGLNVAAVVAGLAAFAL